MKTVLLCFILSTTLAYAETGVRGKVSSVENCSSKVMVWLSLDKENYNERLLLMHTEVPVKGSFQFYLKPGNYQLRATDEKGCEFLKKIKIGNSVLDVPVKMGEK